VEGEHAVGLLRGVVGCATDFDRRERDATGAFANDFLVADRGPAAMALGQGSEIVPLVHLEHVRLEQRVVHAAREADSVVRERVRVELDVFADFLAVGALQPGFQQFEGALNPDLL
jgi:hypothetical protein